MATEKMIFRINEKVELKKRNSKTDSKNIKIFDDLFDKRLEELRHVPTEEITHILKFVF